MFKRVIAALMIAALLGIPAVSYAYTDVNEDNTYYSDILELSQIGVLQGYEDGSFRPNVPLSRAEFCQLIVSMMKLDYGSLKTYFNDVSKEHWAYDPIGVMASNGYVSGDGNATFRPDDTIELYEAISILVRLLGYQYRVADAGGYPYGYHVVASDLGLLKNLNLSGTDILRRDAASRLLNNALDIPIPTATGFIGDSQTYTFDPEITILSKYLKMRRDEGIVSANDLASIKNLPVAADDTIMINGLTFSYEDEEVTKLVGYQVRFIYKIDEDANIKELVSIQKHDNEEVTVDREDYLSFAENKFTYELNEEKTKNLSVSDAVDVIYNGEITNFHQNIFTDVNYGSFTFVSNDNDSSYDVIIINDYNKQIMVGGINRDKYIVSDTNNNSIQVDLDADKRKVLIYNQDGPADFSQIKTNDILLIKENTNIVEVYIGNTSVTGTIEAFEDENLVTVGGTQYETGYYAQSKMKTLNAGDAVQIYLDYNGKIAAATSAATGDTTAMYLVDISNDGGTLESTIRGKFFALDGSMYIYEFADNLKVDGDSMKNATYEELYDRLKTSYTANGELKYQVCGMMMVKLNSSNQVTSLETAKDIDSFSSDEDGFCVAYPQASRTWFENAACFDYEFYATGNAVLLNVPYISSMADAEDEDYSIQNPNTLSNASSYNVEAYSYSKDDANVSVIIRRISVASSSSGPSTSPTVTNKTSLSVVTNVVQAINEDGEVVTRVYYTGRNGDKYVEQLQSKEMSYVQDGVSYKFSDLKKGDVVTINTVGSNTLRAFRVYYKAADKTQVYPETTNFHLSDRTILREVSKASGGTFTLSKEGYADQKFRATESNKVLIVRNNGNKITEGTIYDIAEGDFMIVQTISQYIELIVLYKS